MPDTDTVMAEVPDPVLVTVEIELGVPVVVGVDVPV